MYKHITLIIMIFFIYGTETPGGTKFTYCYYGTETFVPTLYPEQKYVGTSTYRYFKPSECPKFLILPNKGEMKPIEINLPKRELLNK